MVPLHMHPSYHYLQLVKALPPWDSAAPPPLPCNSPSSAFPFASILALFGKHSWNFTLVVSRMRFVIRIPKFLFCNLDFSVGFRGIILQEEYSLSDLFVSKNQITPLLLTKCLLSHSLDHSSI